MPSQARRTDGQRAWAPAFLVESRPSADGTAWKVQLDNPSTADGAFGNIFAVCVG